MLVDIGIIGAMADEVNSIIENLSSAERYRFSGIDFYVGEIFEKRVAVAKCGIGKVFAAICAEAMILNFAPKLIVNTGVGGALAEGLAPLDTVVATRLCQHDMDTSAIGDPVGLVSGINKIFFDADLHASGIILSIGERLGIKTSVGIVASGDQFVSSKEKKNFIVEKFGASVCEMEGCAIAQVAYVNNTPFAVIRAISDSADGSATMDYAEFMPEAAKNSARLTLELIREF